MPTSGPLPVWTARHRERGPCQWRPAPLCVGPQRAPMTAPPSPPDGNIAQRTSKGLPAATPAGPPPLYAGPGVERSMAGLAPIRAGHSRTGVAGELPTAPVRHRRARRLGQGRWAQRRTRFRTCSGTRRIILIVPPSSSLRPEPPVNPPPGALRCPAASPSGTRAPPARAGGRRRWQARPAARDAEEQEHGARQGGEGRGGSQPRDVRHGPEASPAPQATGTCSHSSDADQGLLTRRASQRVRNTSANSHSASDSVMPRDCTVERRSNRWMWPA